MGSYPVQSTGEHTGTTDDTHLVGTDGVSRQGYLCGALITRTGAAGGTITIYDTDLADGAGAFGSEKIILGPIVVKTADAPFAIDLPGRRKFYKGLGADLSAADLGVELFWNS